MSAASPSPYSWQPQPSGLALVERWLERFFTASPAAARFRDQLQRDTGTRFLDWLDTIELPAQSDRRALEGAGFVARDPHADQPERLWAHPQAQLPWIAEATAPDAPIAVWLRCDSAAEFAARHAEAPELAVEGEPLAPYRRVTLYRNRQATLGAVERLGNRVVATTAIEPEQRLAIASVFERFQRRRRQFPSDVDGFEHARKLIDDAVAAVGRDRACALFFRAERRHWQRNNHAAQVQWRRQDRFGLGWGNHDHHTYRCSRQHFARLIGALEALGFVARERFYAGREAGWGAQVLEQPSAGVTVFADVDLSPDELDADFAHEPLAERDTLGTVGLWCALHGDSFLQAGMHHLACLADFDALRDQLAAAADITTMAPFTSLPHLRQAFTTGERWPVAKARLDGLRERGLISAAQAEQFADAGAVGSHLENVERNAGYKGFNQAGISDIIKATDPRH